MLEIRCTRHFSGDQENREEIFRFLNKKVYRVKNAAAVYNYSMTIFQRKIDSLIQNLKTKDSYLTINSINSFHISVTQCKVDHCLCDIQNILTDNGNLLTIIIESASNYE